MAVASLSLQSTTEPVVRSVSVEWTIKQFSKLCQQNYPPLKSPVYYCDGVDLQIRAQYSMTSAQGLHYYNVTFCLVSCTYPLPLRGHYDILYVKNGKDEVCKRNSSITFEALQSYVGMIQNCNSNNLVNDELTTKVNIRFMLPPKHSPKAPKHLTTPDCDLKADLSSLLRDGHLSDVTLVAGEQTFPAHKAILSARSPVFEKMFEHEMKESATSRVGITDIEPPVLQELLLYIYTGELSSKDHKKLLYAADKYQLDRLKVLCGLELSKSLSVDNVAECLCLADSHGASQLREKCVGYITSNRPAVMKTPGWAEVASRNNLLLEILQAMTTDT